MQPCLAAAEAGTGPWIFVDAAHFVFGASRAICGRSRDLDRAASGRQRFHVLGAWDAMTRQLITVTNTTVVNSATMCERLRKIAALGLSGPISWCWTMPGINTTPW